MIKNIIYFSSSLLIFFAGVVAYGVFLNSREKPLSEIMDSFSYDVKGNINIIVDKSRYKLYLYSDTLLIKAYNVSLGKGGQKKRDSFYGNATPVGSYIICKIDTVNKYHKAMIINYPNKYDAAEALRNNQISREIYMKIDGCISANSCTSDVLPDAEPISLHGIGDYDFIFRNLPFVFNWTNGSIALSNKSIDELYSVVGEGTPVLIKP